MVNVPARPAAALIVLVALTGLAACRPADTATNNTAGPLIVDGNYDDANFVVPADEGSGDDNGVMSDDTGTAGHGVAGTATPGNATTGAMRPHGRR